MSEGSREAAGPEVEGPAPGLRQKNRAEVRARLVSAALAAFAELGFEGTTVDAITERAGVSRRTFFRYFPTKEDVVLARRVEQLERFRTILEEPREGEAPFAAVRRAFEALGTDYAAQRRRVLAEHALFGTAPSLVARDLELDRAFEREIGRALGSRARAPAEERRARLCAGAIVGVVRVVVEEWACGRGRGDLAGLGREALDLVAPLAPASALSGAGGRRRD